ncbi:hypothetical protein ACIRSS_04255 [Amycolatopsis sp. NPDC101161]|uniref:hypothetical protein n=1 Tax=Amycolatopsis sp. NPDC101161 TaxID=3363940 RepID=UPI00380A2C28
MPKFACLTALAGARRSFTLAEVERLVSELAETGEYGGGGYFWCSDGLIVGESGLDHMVIALASLHRSGNFRDALNRLDEPAG